MVITQEKIPKLTDFSDESISSNENFTSCVMDQLEKTKKRNEEHLSLSKEFSIIKEKDKNLDEKQKNSLKESNKLLKSIFFKLDNDYQDKVSFYLGKDRASTVVGNSDKSRTLMKNILSSMDSEGHNELNDFRDRLVVLRADLKEQSNELYSMETELSLLKGKLKNNFSDWKLEYSILKDFVKGECKRLGIDYRMFFYDLKYKKSTSSSSKETPEDKKSTEVEVSEDKKVE